MVPLVRPPLGLPALQLSGPGSFTLSFLSSLNLDMNSYFSKAFLHPFLKSFLERDQGPVSGNTCVPQHVLSTSPRQPQVLEHVHMLGSLPSSLRPSLQRALFLEFPYHSSQLPKSLGQSLPKALLYPFYSLVTTVFKFSKKYIYTVI